jgi:hypothetical protein
MKKSYFETQWLLLSFGIISMICSLYCADKMLVNPTTLEALTTTTSYGIGAIAMALLGFLWIFASINRYNQKRFEELENRIKELEGVNDNGIH